MEQLRIAEAIEKKDDLGRKHVLITQMHLESRCNPGFSCFECLN